MGTVIAIVIALFSPLIATAFKEPRLTDILLLLSISFPDRQQRIHALGIVGKKFKVHDCFTD